MKYKKILTNILFAFYWYLFVYQFKAVRYPQKSTS